MKQLIVFVSLCYFVSNALNVVDPETRMTVPEIIRHFGYPCEEKEVTTEDGYILQLHRIPHGKKDSPEDEKDRPVVFLQHGLEDSSFGWVSNFPSQSAGFIFADNGFDVWMGNMRGNKYSRSHIHLNTSEAKFWNFSFDEKIRYDLDAMINFALKTSGQKSLYYVGHSQGTLTMFGKLARDHDFNSKIRQFYALAPVAHVTYMGGIVGLLDKFVYPQVKMYYRIFGDKEFMPTGDLFRDIGELFCNNKHRSSHCDDLVAMIMGVDSNQINATRMPVYYSHIPAGTSTKNIMHWLQLVNSNTLCEYDYGPIENMARYHQLTPPIYDLDQIDTEVHLYWSPADFLADAQDIEEFLIPTLKKNVLVENNKLIGMNHIDFLWSYRATGEIYYPMVETMKKDMEKRDSN